MTTIPAGFIPDQWNQIFGSFRRLVEQLDTMQTLLSECAEVTAENADLEFIRQQIRSENDTLQFMASDAEQRWKALGVTVASAAGRLNLNRPNDDVAWCSSLLHSAWHLHNGLRRELSGENVELCVQRLPLHLGRIPDDISQWRERITAEFRAAALCSEPEQVELVTVKQVAERCYDVDAKTLLNHDVKSWGPPETKIGRERAWSWQKILPMVSEKRRLKAD